MPEASVRPRRPSRALRAVALAGVGMLALAGCAADAASGDDGLRIVTSLDVYADIAETIAQDAAEVTAIVSDAAQDPHEYEAGARDALAISRADIVVLNGGGYDEFMHTLLDAQESDAVIVDAVAVSGRDADGELNEHVWYDLPAMRAYAAELAEHLAHLDPARADDFRDRAAAFAAELTALEERARALAAAHPGAAVASTEPVPAYLLELAGLADLTPADFTEAVEEGADAPVRVLQETLAIVRSGQAAFLAYNEQTVGPQTEEVLAAAIEAGLPVVSFTELLPAGDDYVSWMTANLDAVEAALAR